MGEAGSPDTFGRMSQWILHKMRLARRIFTSMSDRWGWIVGSRAARYSGLC
jgi:hypothetical protein